MTKANRRFQRILFSAFCFAGPLEANASSLEECGRVESSIDRLACYDALSGRTPKPEVLESPGEWRVKTSTNKLTDSTDVFVSVESNDIVHCGFGRESKPVLMLRCLDNTTSLFISSACHVTSGQGSYGVVTTRIDKEPARDIPMDASTDSRALGLWNGLRSIRFIKKMSGKSDFIAQFTPFNESPVIAEFNISGLDEAIKPLRKACSW